MQQKIDEPTQATRRKRRYRARLASGAGVLTVPVRELNKLIGALAGPALT
jgi:hypothetical protein